MVVSFKGAHFPQDIILTGVRWYVAYPLSTRRRRAHVSMDLGRVFTFAVFTERAGRRRAWHNLTYPSGTRGQTGPP
jgi:hypothetical protein